MPPRVFRPPHALPLEIPQRGRGARLEKPAELPQRVRTQRAELQRRMQDRAGWTAIESLNEYERLVEAEGNRRLYKITDPQTGKLVWFNAATGSFTEIKEESQANATTTAGLASGVGLMADLEDFEEWQVNCGSAMGNFDETDAPTKDYDSVMIHFNGLSLQSNIGQENKPAKAISSKLLPRVKRRTYKTAIRNQQGEENDDELSLNAPNANHTINISSPILIDLSITGDPTFLHRRFQANIQRYQLAKQALQKRDLEDIDSPIAQEVNSPTDKVQAPSRKRCFQVMAVESKQVPLKFQIKEGRERTFEHFLVLRGSKRLKYVGFGSSFSLDLGSTSSTHGNHSPVLKLWLVANKLDNNTATTTFHSFPNLPQELQDQIWEFSLHSRKQVMICGKVIPHNLYRGPDLHHFVSQRKAPLEIENVCLASKAAYARFKNPTTALAKLIYHGPVITIERRMPAAPDLTYRYPNGPRSATWDFEKDLVVLPDCSFFAMWDFVEIFRAEIKKLKHLVIAPLKNANLQIIIEKLRHFKNLEHVLLVWGYEYDGVTEKWSVKPPYIGPAPPPAHIREQIDYSFYEDDGQWDALVKRRQVDLSVAYLEQKWPEWKMPKVTTLVSGEEVA